MCGSEQQWVYNNHNECCEQEAQSFTEPAADIIAGIIEEKFPLMIWSFDGHSRISGRLSYYFIGHTHSHWSCRRQ